MTATSTAAAPEKDTEKQEPPPAAGPGASTFGHRHLMLLLLSAGVAEAYACRVNISMCIVAMNSPDASLYGYQKFEWTGDQRSWVLSSFFVGYVLMQVPGSILANRYGPARLILLGVSCCSALTCITPLAAALGGWPLMCALRVAEGLCQGVIFPCTHFMLGRWAPPVERGRMGAIVFSGPSIGTLGGMAGVGLLCGSRLGWPSGFYVPGLLGLVWSVAWWRYGADSPASCTWISAAEREYIQTALDTPKTERRLRVPWLSIVTSPPMWALTVVHIGSNFGHWMLLTQMPTYMKDMLHFDIKSNGVMSSLPYAALACASATVGWASQRVNEANCVSIVTSRKIFNSIAHYGMAVTFLALSFLTPLGIPVYLAVGLLTLAVALESGLLAGFLVNHVDLSPNFGGAMLGISNGLGNTMGIIAPLVVSALVSKAEGEVQTHEELAVGWSRVFLLGSCVYFTGNTVFLLMGRAEVQPWNTPEDVAASKDDPAEAHELLKLNKV